MTLIPDTLRHVVLIKSRYGYNNDDTVWFVDDESSNELKLLKSSLGLIFDVVEEFGATHFLSGRGGASIGGAISLRGPQANALIQKRFEDNAYIPASTPVFPIDSTIGSFIFNSHHTSPNRILAALAASGIQTCFPNLLIQEAEVVGELKEKYATEREEYLQHFVSHISAAYERVAEGKYKDAWEYAAYNTNPQLSAALSNYTNAILKSDKRLLKSIASGTLKQSPALVSTATVPGSMAVILFQVLVSSYSQTLREKLAKHGLPHVSYLYQISKIEGE